MMLRAWALIDDAGALIKGSPNVSGASKTAVGKYSFTLSDGNASANAVLRGVANKCQFGTLLVQMPGPPVTNTVSYWTQTSDSAAQYDTVTHVELWE
ncbi:hypothetical protein C6571_16775 [Simplicispira suum]|uniref:Uncharacterized protein n=2 Tax=Simplicispira suum TaxID=2109915 RepID=A0A2S0N3N7_9BURK|nr:hypothetical protein C6571_16775 [Simplicispira suum]